jgi:hypothetical protein
MNPQKTLFKLVLNMMGLSQRKREAMDSKIIEIGSIDNAIPYKEFFELFVNEYSLLENQESMSLFTHLKGTGKKN